MKNNIIAICIIAIVALAGCGEKPGATISGTYVDKDGSKFVFEGGKVTSPATATDHAVTTDFTVTGNTLKFQFPNGYPVEASINPNGTFTTNYGYVYKKVN